MPVLPCLCAQSPAGPSVPLMSVDDVNYRVACLGGHPGVRTPTISALARLEALYRGVQCISPYGNPSRSAVANGLRRSTTGVYDKSQFWKPVRTHAVTLG